MKQTAFEKKVDEACDFMLRKGLVDYPTPERLRAAMIIEMARRYPDDYEVYRDAVSKGRRE